jgi:hypothetical protein
MKYRWKDSIGAPISFLVDVTKNYTVAMINFKNGKWFGVVKDRMIGPYDTRAEVISVVEERLGLESGTTTIT